jgi:cystine transport system substrate-binding protein
MFKAQNALPKQRPFATVRALCGAPVSRGHRLTEKTIQELIAMKSIRSLLLIGLLQVAAATTAFAADGLAQIKSAGVFKIGTEGTYAPFSFHDASGQLTGFDVEIGREIAKRLGVKAEFVEGKWDGLIAGLDVNRYDAVINEVAITDARKVKYDFSEPYIASHAALIVRTDNTSIKSFDDLKGKKSANTLTSNFGKLAAARGAEVVPVQGFNESIDLLTSGRVDATVNDSLSFLDFKKHKPDAKVKIAAIDNGADSDHSAVLIRKGNPELKAAIDKALHDMRADGTYAKISDKYFGKDVSQ